MTGFEGHTNQFASVINFAELRNTSTLIHVGQGLPVQQTPRGCPSHVNYIFLVLKLTLYLVIYVCVYSETPSCVNLKHKAAADNIDRGKIIVDIDGKTRLYLHWPAATLCPVRYVSDVPVLTHPYPRAMYSLAVGNVSVDKKNGVDAE